MSISKAIICVAAGLTAVAGGANAESETADKRIALSNNYAGNSWRQAMLSTFEETAKDAVSNGVVAAADAFTTSENQATEQAAQIQNMILQGYDGNTVGCGFPDRAEWRG